VSKTASKRRSFSSTRGPSQLESLQRKIWSRKRTLLSRRKGMVEVRLSVCPSVCTSVCLSICLYVCLNDAHELKIQWRVVAFRTNCQGDPPILSFIAFLLRSFLTICRYIPLSTVCASMAVYLFVSQFCWTTD
jgi:hypothetical protein